MERLTGKRPRRCVVDQGYRGHGVDPTHTEVLISRQRRTVTRAQKQALRRRHAIEPIIGHMKADGLLGRNFLKGATGDQLNALLCGVGQNLRAILRHLRVFLWRVLFPVMERGAVWLHLACQASDKRLFQGRLAIISQCAKLE